MCRSNVALPSATGRPTRSEALQLPQLPPSASRSRGSRLVVWQWGQTTSSESVTRRPFGEFPGDARGPVPAQMRPDDAGFNAAGAQLPTRGPSEAMVIGFRILGRTRKVDVHVVEQFREPAGGQRQRLDVPADAREARGCGRCTAAGAMAGPAFTVKTRPGDNLMVHKALDIAEAGDVLVVDAGGDLTNAIIGEIMSTYARQRGLAGIVINGAIRDADAIRASDVSGVRGRRHASLARTRTDRVRSTCRSRSTAW